MSLRLDSPGVYRPARPAMTRLGVSVDELESLIEEYEMWAAIAKVHGDGAMEAKQETTADFLRSELALHLQQHARGWRQLLRWLGAAFVAFAAPVLVICVILGMFDLGSVLSQR